MTHGPEKIFDRALLARRRARFARDVPAHDFLMRRASEDIATRLGAVMRDFPLALDLGSHHGVLGRLLSGGERVGHIVSADPCAALVAQAGGLRVACDEEALPFADASLDLVVSGLSLHLVNDLPGALIQIRRSLRPDGLFLAAVLGGDTLRELREVLTMAEEEIDGGASPRVAPFADVRDYGALLQRTGFALPVADTDVVEVTYESALHLMREIRAMGAANVLTARRRAPLKRSILMRAGALYAELYPAPNGRIAATFEIVHLTGWAPDASQPRPLKPGSARTRLADALGTEEIPAGDKADPTGRR